MKTNMKEKKITLSATELKKIAGSIQAGQTPVIRYGCHGGMNHGCSTYH